MWKYFAALVVLLTLGGLSVAQIPAAVPDECTDCYANIITQTDTQSIADVRLGYTSLEPEDAGINTVAVANEGLSAAIIVTDVAEDAADGSQFASAPFARIDQVMDQSIAGLGSADMTQGEGAKGVTFNKAIQAAWITGQGIKETETDETGAEVVMKEGAYIAQTTVQDITNIYDYDSRESAKVLNVDNKLAMIVDDVNKVIDIAAKATSDTSDNASSAGAITNSVDVTIAAVDP